jgi:hypothetical protein
MGIKFIIIALNKKINKMQKQEIENIIYSYYPDNIIYALDINICPINKQIEQIKIIFKSENPPDLNAIGSLINDLDNLTIKDNYGDITEIKLSISRFEEIGDDLTTSFTFDINIDS